jgi:hypothetical protein
MGRIPPRTTAVIPHLTKKRVMVRTLQRMLTSQSMKTLKNSKMKKSRSRNRKTLMKKKSWLQSASSSTLLLNMQTQLMTSSCIGEYRKKHLVNGQPLMTGTCQRRLSGSVIRLLARRSSTKTQSNQHSGLFTSTFNGRRRWNQLLDRLVLCSMSRRKIHGTTMVVKTTKFPLTCQ